MSMIAINSTAIVLMMIIIATVIVLIMLVGMIIHNDGDIKSKNDNNS